MDDIVDELAARAALVVATAEQAEQEQRARQQRVAAQQQAERQSMQKLRGQLRSALTQRDRSVLPAVDPALRTALARFYAEEAALLEAELRLRCDHVAGLLAKESAVSSGSAAPTETVSSLDAIRAGRVETAATEPARRPPRSLVQQLRRAIRPFAARVLEFAVGRVVAATGNARETAAEVDPAALVDTIVVRSDRFLLGHLCTLGWWRCQAAHETRLHRMQTAFGYARTIAQEREVWASLLQ